MSHLTKAIALLFLVSACGEQKDLAQNAPAAKKRPNPQDRMISKSNLVCGYQFAEENKPEYVEEEFALLEGRWIQSGTQFGIYTGDNGETIYTKLGYEFNDVTDKYGKIRFYFEDSEPGESSEVLLKSIQKLGMPINAGKFEGYRPLELHYETEGRPSCDTFLFKIKKGTPEEGTETQLYLYGPVTHVGKNRAPESELHSRVEEQSPLVLDRFNPDMRATPNNE